MNALALSRTPSVSFLYFLFMSVCFFDFISIKVSFKKYIHCGREGGFLKKGMKTKRGRAGQAYLYVYSVKNSLIFQITANRVLSDKLLDSCLRFFCFAPAHKSAFC